MSARLAATLLVLIAVGHAAADPRGDSRARYEQGTRLYNLGKFDEAIVEFEEAYKLDPDPAYLFNLAQAHRLAKHRERALFNYRRYLELAPDAPNRADTEQLIAELEAEQAREDTATKAPPPDGGVPQPAVTPPPSRPRFRANVDAGIAITYLGDKTMSRPPTQLSGRAVFAVITHHGRWTVDYGVAAQYTTLPFETGQSSATFSQIHGIASATHPIAGRLSGRVTVGVGFGLFSRLDSGNPINAGGEGSGARAVWSLRSDSHLTFAIQPTIDATLGLFGIGYSPRSSKLDPMISRIVSVETFYLGLGARF